MAVLAARPEGEELLSKGIHLGAGREEEMDTRNKVCGAKTKFKIKMKKPT